jgi:hypothetical protein
MSVKRQPVSLSVKPRGKPTIDEDAVEDFGNQAETETQKKTSRRSKVLNKQINGEKSTPRNPKKKIKPAAEKVKRDSFTMPENDYEIIGKLISKLMRSGILMNKGEVLRAGLKALNSMPIKELKAVCEEVEKIKTGRPKE